MALTLVLLAPSSSSSRASAASRCSSPNGSWAGGCTAARAPTSRSRSTRPASSRSSSPARCCTSRCCSQNVLPALRASQHVHQQPPGPPTTSIYIGLYGLLIIVFAYFYTAITFDPHQQADIIRKQGGYIPGIRPGPPTERYLAGILNRITLPGSLFLAVIALLPSIALSRSGISTVPVRRHHDPHRGRRRPRDDEADRQPADDAELRGLPEVGVPGSEAGHPRQAGRREGNAVRSPGPPLRRAPHLHRRHVPRRRQVGHRVRPKGQGVHGRRRAGARRRRHRHGRGAPRPGRHRRRGFVLDGFPAPCTRPRRSTTCWRPRPRPRHRPRGRRPTSCSSAWPVGGSASTAAPTTASTAPPEVDWTCDVCGGEVVQRADDTEAAIHRRLELYDEQTAPLIAWYLERDKLVTVDGVGTRRR